MKGRSACRHDASSKVTSIPLAASCRADAGGTSAYDDVETAGHVAVGDTGRWMSEAPRVAEIALFEPVRPLGRTRSAAGVSASEKAPAAAE